MSENASTTTDFNVGAFNLRKAEVLREIEKVRKTLDRSASQVRVLDLGCGNGLMVKALVDSGYGVVGVDIDSDQITKARAINGEQAIFQSSVFDFVATEKFDIVVSLEVIEHLYDPCRYLELSRSHLAPGGLLFLSTPYYGYWKNLLLSLLGKWDSHHMPLKLHGHIKLFSMRTLATAIHDAGYEILSIKRLGRIPAFAMMQFVVARKIQ